MDRKPSVATNLLHMNGGTWRTNSLDNDQTNGTGPNRTTSNDIRGLNGAPFNGVASTHDHDENDDEELSIGDPDIDDIDGNELCECVNGIGDGGLDKVQHHQSGVGATGGGAGVFSRSDSCEANASSLNNAGTNINSTTCDSIENIPLNNRLSCNSSSAINMKPCSHVRHPSNQLSVNGKCADNGPFSNTNYRCAGGYLIAIHRKLSRQDTYFLSYHKTRPSLFGVPLLIPCYDGGTNKDLYCAVWVQVARLLSPLPSTPPDQSNHATDW